MSIYHQYVIFSSIHIKYTLLNIFSRKLEGDNKMWVANNDNYWWYTIHIQYIYMRYEQRAVPLQARQFLKWGDNNILVPQNTIDDTTIKTIRNDPDKSKLKKNVNTGK